MVFKRYFQIVVLMFMIITLVLSGCANTNQKQIGKPDSTNKSTVKPDPSDSSMGTEGVFPEVYAKIPGVLTFRGNNLRNSPSYGTVSMTENKFKKLWTVNTPGNGSIWGGGTGWTGQPALVQWDEATKQAMNIYKEFKDKKDFVEVIVGTLSGKVYFLDLQTGKETRPPIDTKNPIKGSVSIDPRGYPLLYVGQGIDFVGNVGIHLFNLLNQKEIYYKNIYDTNAPRRWQGNDSSALFNSADDTLFIPSENGLVYKLKLNTNYDPANNKYEIKPVLTFFNTQKVSGMKYKDILDPVGIESSASAYKDMLYFSDNGGLLWCMTTDMKKKWSIKNYDESDVTPTVDVENGVPYLYMSNSIHYQGEKGDAHITKFNGETGKEVWTTPFKCYTRMGASPSKGGSLATSIVGKNDIKDLVIFSLCRTPDFATGMLVAIDKSTGKVRWNLNMDTYAWPSPVDVYNSDGKSYIIQADHNGYMLILEGKTGKVLYKEQIDSYIEGSPAVFGNYLVIGSRSGKIYGFKLS